MTRGDVILLAAGSASVAGVTAPILPPQIALLWYCIGGAILGAIGAAAIPTAEEPSWKQLAWRIFGCAAFGGSVSPWLIRYMGWPVDAETVLGVSATVGALAWLGGRVVSKMTPGELRDFMLHVFTFGRSGRGRDDGRD